MKTRGLLFIIILSSSLLFFSKDVRAYGYVDEVAQFLDAYRQFENNDPGGDKTLLEIANTDAAMADHASYKTILVRYQNGRWDGIDALIENHLERFASSRFTPEVRLINVEILTALDKYVLALEQLDVFRSNNPDIEESRVFTLLGAIKEGQGKAIEAQDAYASAAYLFGYQKWAERAAAAAKSLEKSGVAKRTYPSREELLDRIQKAWDIRYFITCGRLCDVYLRIYSGKSSWQVRLKAVDCLLERGKRRDARALLSDIDSQIPDRKEAQAALMLRYARAERGRDFRGKPRTSFSAVMADFPDTVAADQAAYFLGYIQYDDFLFEQAAANLDRYLKSGKDALYLDHALWLCGYSHYMSGNFQQAAQLFSHFLTRFPQHKDRDRAVYWRARASEKLGKKESAVKDYQWLNEHYLGTYYGLAAQVRLELAGKGHYSSLEMAMEQFPWEHLVSMMPVPRLPSDWAQTNGGGPVMDDGAQNSLAVLASYGPESIRVPVRNFLALHQAGETERALKEAQFLFDRRVGEPYAGYIAGVMYSLCEENLQAIIAANKAAEKIREGELFDPHRVNARRQFPLLYFDLIEETAKRYELDPFFVIGLVKQESAFQINAKSWAGARGLFQVMPGTGKWIAHKRGIKGFKVTDLYEPETSADFGVWYIKRLIDNFDGDVLKALAGYNAGGGRALRWWGANPGIAMDEMVELIVFTETRNYVKIILRNWEMYQRLYRDPEKPYELRESVFVRLLDFVPESKAE